MSRELTSVVLACALVCACGESSAPAPATQSLVGHPIEPDPQRMMAAIEELASDAYGGREPMSEGEELTLNFLQSQFEAMGLEPLFKGRYRQPVDLVSIEADPSTVRMTFHLPDRDRLVAYEDEMVAFSPRVVPESRVENADIVFVGYGIVAPEYGWDDYADVDVSGKTVLVLVNDPGFATGNPALFNGKAMTYYGRWTYKYEEAARQGAAAVLIIHDTEPAAYGWEVVRNSWTGPQFHRHQDNDNLHRSAIESWVQRGVAEELVASSGLDLSDLERRAQSPEFRAVSLGSTMDASVQNRIVRRQSYNIGALLSGDSAAEELFLYVAHWDHIGTDSAAPEGQDAIYNGAVDNASGLAALLELARGFVALPRAPRRSVGFLAVTAEESGLIGSAHYADHPPVPMNRTVAGINMDALNVYGPTHDVIVVGYGNSELEDLLRNAARAQNRQIEPEKHPERGSYYRSDHFNLARKGVPMLYAKSGTDHVELGSEYLERLSLDYLHNRYHTVHDEISDDWDLRGLQQDIELYFAIGLELADSDLWPQWYEGNEFREVREQSLRTLH